MSELNRCANFLLLNGFDREDEDEEYITMTNKSTGVSIDLEKSGEEIVFIGDIGDWLHIPCNYYALIGAMVHFRLISYNYKSTHPRPDF